jgi:hypothetical protein
LEGGDVGLKFQLKMIEFMDSMNQVLKRGKNERAHQDKVGQGKYAKYVFEVGKARKVKDFLLEMDNYYDVQKPEKTKNVSIAVPFLKDHVLQWWMSKK